VTWFTWFALFFPGEELNWTVGSPWARFPDMSRSDRAIPASRAGFWRNSVDAEVPWWAGVTLRALGVVHV